VKIKSTDATLSRSLIDYRDSAAVADSSTSQFSLVKACLN